MAPAELLPLTLVCSELGVRYNLGRDLALTGQLKSEWIGGRLFVPRSSVEAYKATRPAATTTRKRPEVKR